MNSSGRRPQVRIQPRNAHSVPEKDLQDLAAEIQEALQGFDVHIVTYDNRAYEGPLIEVLEIIIDVAFEYRDEIEQLGKKALEYKDEAATVAVKEISSIAIKWLRKRITKDPEKVTTEKVTSPQGNAKNARRRLQLPRHRTRALRLRGASGRTIKSLEIRTPTGPVVDTTREDQKDDFRRLPGGGVRQAVPAVDDPVEVIANLQARLTAPHGLYSTCKEIDDYPLPGTWNLMMLRSVAFCHQHFRQFLYEPLRDYDQILSVLAFQSRLRSAGAAEEYVPQISIGFQFFESAYFAQDGRLTLPDPDDRFQGRHVVSVIGWEDKGESLVFVNSWGEKWGDRGIGRMPRAYAKEHLLDCWVGWNARVGMTRFTLERIVKAPNEPEFLRSWMTQNPRWRSRHRHNGRQINLVRYEAWSLGSECAVDIIDLRAANGLRVGWTYVFHIKDGNRKVSVVQELFVWPWFRRRGYGSVLEDAAVEIARLRRSEVVRMSLHEADAQTSSKQRAEQFGIKRGYSWDWSRSTLPAVEGVAEKLL